MKIKLLLRIDRVFENKMWIPQNNIFFIWPFYLGVTKHFIFIASYLDNQQRGEWFITEKKT